MKNSLYEKLKYYVAKMNGNVSLKVTLLQNKEDLMGDVGLRPTPLGFGNGVAALRKECYLKSSFRMSFKIQMFFVVCSMFFCVHAKQKQDDDIFVEQKKETKKNKKSVSDVKEECAREMKETIKQCMELQKSCLDTQDIFLKKIEELVDEDEGTFFEECSKEELELITKKILDLQSFVQDVTLDIEKKTYSIFKKPKK